METPFVSVIVPVRNEEEYLQRCLDSILQTDYPQEFLEVLIIDGMSEDRSRAIVKDYILEYPVLTLFENPKQFQVAALNLGIRKAKGSIVIRMDAHTVYPVNYIRCCVELLQTREASNVGGILRAEGKDYISKAISLAVTSPFGVGDAKYRVSNKEQWVDTVFPGAWLKKTLEDLGGFSEDWKINEDYELNYRLRQNGGRILLSPTIQCHYYVRNSVPSLIKQYFRYGFWKVKTIAAHPDSLRWRQLIAPLFVVGLFLSFLLSLTSSPLFWIFPLVYLLANILFSAHLSSSKGVKYFALLPILYLAIHMSWGVGYWCGVFKWGLPKISWKNIRSSFKKIHLEGNRSMEK